MKQDEEVFVLRMAVYDGGIPDDYLTVHRTRDDAQREIESTAHAYGIDLDHPTGAPDNGTLGTRDANGQHIDLGKRESWLSFVVTREPLQG